MKKNKRVHKKQLTHEIEKEIFDSYKTGMKRKQIKLLYKINDNQFQNIIKMNILKENNAKDLKKKWKWVGHKNGGFEEIK